MPHKILATIENCPIGYNSDTHQLTFTAKAAIDNDGTEDRDHDPDHQNNTNLHHNGKALDAYVDKYIVLPIFLFKLFPEIGLGSMCLVTNTRNGRFSHAVVGDKGPNKKIGEISPALASAIGLDPSARHGGEDAHTIQYEVDLGTPAVVDGIQYTLQKS